MEALALAQRSGDMKLTLEALSALAALAFRRGRPDVAGQLLIFILGHKATAQEVRDAANELLSHLPPTGLTMRKEIDLATAVALATSA
ncbi:MAG: hypothetical protein IPM39_16925 [Chloroflexi bacterium]|nr:hypothetical protein [Chloroflexota bacterium]